MIFRGSESPGYYPRTPPQHQKGRPRKRKVGIENESPCGELPVTMRMAAATLGWPIFPLFLFLFKKNYSIGFTRRKNIDNSNHGILGGKEKT